MESLTGDLDSLLAWGVEPELKRVDVKAAPVLQEGVQPLAWRTLLPTRPEPYGPSVAVQPLAELVQRTGIQSTTPLDNPHALMIIHAVHRDTRRAPGT